MYTILFFLLLCSIALIISQCHVSKGAVHIASPSQKLETKANQGLDEQLYSRQIAVYGKSAQQQLLNAHVVIYGSGSLAAEVIKNLALAGIGRLSVVQNIKDRIGPPAFLHHDLVSYARSLNSQITVRESSCHF
jgi:ThiF family